MVKCSECGLLCGEGMDGNLVELGGKARTTGDLGHNKLLKGVIPFCYDDLLDFNELHLKETGSNRPEKMLRAISAKRECSAFIKYTKGYSPTEHKENARAFKPELRDTKLKVLGLVIAVIAIVVTILIAIIK